MSKYSRFKGNEGNLCMFVVQPGMLDLMCELLLMKCITVGISTLGDEF